MISRIIAGVQAVEHADWEMVGVIGCRPTSLLPDESGTPMGACVYLLFVQCSRYFRNEPFLEACALYKIFVHIACML